MKIDKSAFFDQFQAAKLVELFEDRLSESRTIGKDGITPYAFGKKIEEESNLISKRALTGTYNFTTYKQRLILKSANKPPRNISIATVRDRLTLRALTQFLSDRFPDASQPPAHAIIAEIKNQIEYLSADYSFVQIDVENFYPTVRHTKLRSILKKNLNYPPFLKLVMSAVSTPTGDKYNTSNIGIPQGLSISNILSAIYMMEFDQKSKEFNTYYRYVDDILIICQTKDAYDIYLRLKADLRKLGLKCHPLEDKKKTKIVPLNEGVDYLGYHIKPGYITVRLSSYHRMIENIMRVFTAVKYEKNYRKALMRLNLKITGCVFNEKRMGWMFFFSMTDDIKQLQRLDNFVLKNFIQYFPTGTTKPKRFLKAYYEIKFNFSDSKYIPRFDEYTQEQKITFIATMMNEQPAIIDTWSIDKIEREFRKLLKKEMAELEKDITPVS